MMHIWNAASGTGLWAMAQSPVNDRLAALRKTATDLENQSGIDQIVPFLYGIGIALLVAVCLYGVYLLWQKWRRTQGVARRAGLTRGELSWLRKRAEDSGLEPSSRILQASSAFEQVGVSYLSRQLSASQWPKPAIRMRNLASRLGFALSASPEHVATTIDIGSPWPVVVWRDGSQRETDGFVGQDTIDEFTVHVIDDLDVLGDVQVGTRIGLRVVGLDGDTEPSFVCSCIQLRKRGPYRTLRLKHSAESLGAGGTLTVSRPRAGHDAWEETSS